MPFTRVLLYQINRDVPEICKYSYSSGLNILGQRGYLYLYYLCTNYVDHNLHWNYILNYLLSWIHGTYTVTPSPNNNQRLSVIKSKQRELLKWSTRKIIQINNGSVSVTIISAFLIGVLNDSIKKSSVRSILLNPENKIIILSSQI